MELHLPRESRAVPGFLAWFAAVVLAGVLAYATWPIPVRAAKIPFGIFMRLLGICSIEFYRIPFMAGIFLLVAAVAGFIAHLEWPDKKLPFVGYLSVAAICGSAFLVWLIRYIYNLIS